MDQQSEIQIADGLRSGKSEAWQVLYDACAEQIWRLVARLMYPQTSDVADVVQETFLVAARSARQYDPSRGRLSVWLRAIARNQVAQYYRKQRRGDRLLSDAVSNGKYSSEVLADPAEALLGEELACCIRYTLSKLSAEHETLLSARYIDGASIQHLAVEAGTTNQAIRSRLVRARRAFGRAFSGGEGGGHDK